MMKVQRQHYYLRTCLCAAAKIPGSSCTGAIAGGVAVGLLFAASAIGFAWWRRRRPIEAFFDVPGKNAF